MKIVKFEGGTMREALAKVKAELGDQAVIVSTRQIRRGLLGTACEIAAAIDTADDDDPPPMPRFHAAPPTPPPAPAPSEDVEKAVAPLRSELRSLRALIRAAGDNRSTTELRNELAALRRLVEELAAPPQPPPAAPAAAVATAASLLAAARARLPLEQADHGDHAAKPAPRATPLTAPSTGEALMLVGPTGVGKTTTIAKLAARAALIDGKSVCLVTLDSYRVGGVDQIRTFAELIGVPLRTPANPAGMADIFNEGFDLILIDTAGRSPRDSAAIDELAAALPNLPPIEVHLVVAAGTTPTIIDDVARRYAGVNPSRLLFTKVDEVDEAPELARAPQRLALPITWITTGQAVPEDLEEPTNARVLELATTGLASISGISGRAPRNRTNRYAAA
jgi:flagellar biosynthesis protein FlhF